MANFTWTNAGGGDWSTTSVAWLNQRLGLRPKALAEALTARGLTDEETVQLLVRWIRYAYFRDDATWRAFNEYLEYLAQHERLFQTQCRILHQFGYMTVVIMIDQAEKLVDQARLTQAVINVRDVGDTTGVNLFFVFAGTAEVSKLRDERVYGGFVRRFLDPARSSVVEATLDAPKIDGGDDDLMRVRASLQNIAAKHPVQYAHLEKTDVQIATIRDKLGSSGKPVTWPVFWRALLAPPPS